MLDVEDSLRAGESFVGLAFFVDSFPKAPLPVHGIPGLIRIRLRPPLFIGLNDFLHDGKLPVRPGLPPLHFIGPVIYQGALSPASIVL
jgi:hypothetical protein